MGASDSRRSVINASLWHCDLAPLSGTISNVALVGSALIPLILFCSSYSAVLVLQFSDRCEAAHDELSGMLSGRSTDCPQASRIFSEGAEKITKGVHAC